MRTSFNPRLFSCLISAFLFSFIFTQDISPNPPAITTSESVIRTLDNTYIIIAATNTLPPELLARMESLEAQFTSVLDEVGVAVVTSTHPEFAIEAANIQGIMSVANDIEVQWIDPADYESETIPYSNPPFSNDNDEYFNLQWGLDAINAVEAWEIGRHGQGVLVAVIDSGFDLNHPDLKPNIDLSKSTSFVPKEGLQYNGTGLSHGSHVAGIIAAADNGIGIIGVAPEARLMLVKVLNDNGTGQFTWALEGIKHAIDMDADIINMSFGGNVPLNSSLIEAFKRMTTYAHNKGVTLVAAAGNKAYNLTANKTHLYIPATSPYVLAISATTPIGWAQYPLLTSFDNIANYSDYGKSVIDFAAPGGNRRFAGTGNATIANITRAIAQFDRVFSVTIGGWTWASGTSMATPHATGVIALVISNNLGRMHPDEIKRVLEASSDDLGAPGPDDFFGHGRLNAFQAIKCLQKG